MKLDQASNETLRTMLKRLGYVPDGRWKHDTLLKQVINGLKNQSIEYKGLEVEQVQKNIEDYFNDIAIDEEIQKIAQRNQDEINDKNKKFEEERVERERKRVERERKRIEREKERKIEKERRLIENERRKMEEEDRQAYLYNEELNKQFINEIKQKEKEAETIKSINKENKFLSQLNMSEGYQLPVGLRRGDRRIEGDIDALIKTIGHNRNRKKKD
jgi:hypothetical protein